MFTTDCKVAECAVFHVSSSIALSFSAAGAGADAKFRKCINDVFISHMVITDSSHTRDSPDSDQCKFMMCILEVRLLKDNFTRCDWDGHRHNTPAACV